MSKFSTYLHEILREKEVKNGEQVSRGATARCTCAFQATRQSVMQNGVGCRVRSLNNGRTDRYAQSLPVKLSNFHLLARPLGVFCKNPNCNFLAKTKLSKKLAEELEFADVCYACHKKLPTKYSTKKYQETMLADSPKSLFKVWLYCSV